MKMNQKGNDFFETPKYIFKQLNRIFNFQMDVACTELNCLCERGVFYDWNEDALDAACNWSYRTFCNPPFSKKADFIRKADIEVQSGRCPICVMILPLNSMDTKVWHEVIEGKYQYEILKGIIAFINPETKEAKKGNNSGTVIVYFKKRVIV